MSDTSASPDSVVVSDLQPASASSASAAISRAARKTSGPPRYQRAPGRRGPPLVAPRRRRQGDARNPRQPLRQPAGVLVVLRQALHHVLQRVPPRGGDNARLPHAAPQHHAVPPRPPDD